MKSAHATVATTGRTAKPGPDKATAKFEVDFLRKMIDHHEMGIDMANMCAKEAVHDPLRNMGEKISAAQMSEVTMMQGRLVAWYDKSHEPMMTAAMKAQMKRLGSLHGAEFEIAFMKSMVRHHARAITMAKKGLDRASHRELITMCRDVIKKQEKEISQMRDWLCEWHDVCGPAGSKGAES